MAKDKTPKPIRKDAPSAMLHGRIKNVEVAGKGLPTEPVHVIVVTPTPEAAQ